MRDKMPWRRIVLEGAVIVASILLAFAIDRSYESSQDRSEEEAILLGLRADFAANRITLTEYLESYRRTTEAIASVLHFVADGQVPPGAPAIGVAFTTLYTNRTFDPRTATLDLIESSGSGRVVRDPDLQRLISEWRMHSADALDQQQGLQRNRESMLWPALVALDVQTFEGRRRLIDAPPTSPSRRDLQASNIGAVLDVYAALVSRTTLDLSEVLDASDAVLARLDVLLDE